MNTRQIGSEPRRERMDRTVNTRIRTLLRRDEGASAIEYSFLVAAIAAIIVVVVFAIGSKLQQAAVHLQQLEHRGGHHRNVLT